MYHAPIIIGNVYEFWPGHLYQGSMRWIKGAKPGELLRVTGAHEKLLLYHVNDATTDEPRGMAGYSSLHPRVNAEERNAHLIAILSR
jgi:hypothetical protein